MGALLALPALSSKRDTGVEEEEPTTAEDEAQQEQAVEGIAVCVGAPDAPLSDAARLAIEGADIILVSGGNTLFAYDRWRETGVDVLLKKAAARGCVLAGGSAGAICWFDAGHSDSADPASFYECRMREESGGGGAVLADCEHLKKLSGLGIGETVEAEFLAAESHTHTVDGEHTALTSWPYIRVPSLGFLPGLCCPHYDQVQSNGVLRADDLENMLKELESGERAIGIDHWAALVVEGRWTSTSGRLLVGEGRLIDHWTVVGGTA